MSTFEEKVKAKMEEIKREKEEKEEKAITDEAIKSLAKEEDARDVIILANKSENALKGVIKQVFDQMKKDKGKITYIE